MPTQIDVTKPNRFSFRKAMVTLGLAGVLVAGSVAPADAAPGHYNTDPYLTGCASSRVPINWRPAGQGGFTTFYSTSCKTNWIEWSGPKVCTWKRVQSNYGHWTRKEIDYASWSYSMQAYAPGNTALQVEYAVSVTGYANGRCAGSWWDNAHEWGNHGWYTVR